MSTVEQAVDDFPALERGVELHLSLDEPHLELASGGIADARFGFVEKLTGDRVAAVKCVVVREEDTQPCAVLRDAAPVRELEPRFPLGAHGLEVALKLRLVGIRDGNPRR